MLERINFRRSRNRLEGDAPAKGQGAAGVPSVPDSMCTRCPACGELLFTAELAKACEVCPKCGHHFRMSARARVALVCDAGCFNEWDAGIAGGDPIEFPGYAAKLRKSAQQSGEREAVITGGGAVSGLACALFAMEPAFMMGSMGGAVGEKLTRMFERAAQRRLPVVGFTVSGGARMQEGILSLMQMAKVSGAVKRHSDAGLLYAAVLTDPTTGGVTASFAMEGDILLAEPGALIGFAGPRVIEQTMRQKLPKDFQRAEFLLEKGFLDAVIPRPRMKATLAHILRLHAAPRAD